MKTTREPNMSVSSRLGVGSWTILIVLFPLLAATFVIIYLGWTLANRADVPTSGYIAMALGVIVSLAVGFGLMALIFCSSRKGYDEPPVLIAPGGDGNESDAVSASEITDRTSSPCNAAGTSADHAPVFEGKILLFLIRSLHRQGKLKAGPTGYICLRPQPATVNFYY
jgi:hypothetical protein